MTMAKLVCTLILPITQAEGRGEIIDQLERNAFTGEGLTITMPDGFRFDVILDEVDDGTPPLDKVVDL